MSHSLTLDHKVLNHTVEVAPLESKALLSSAKCTEVIGSLGHVPTVKTHHNFTGRLVTDGDVKENLLCDGVRVVLLLVAHGTHRLDLWVVKGR